MNELNQFKAIKVGLASLNKSENGQEVKSNQKPLTIAHCDPKKKGCFVNAYSDRQRTGNAIAANIRESATKA